MLLVVKHSDFSFLEVDNYLQNHHVSHELAVPEYEIADNQIVPISSKCMHQLELTYSMIEGESELARLLEPYPRQPAL